MSDEFDLSSLIHYDFVEDLLEEDSVFYQNFEEILDPEVETIIKEMSIYP
jgi:hypothetical protein